MGFDLGAIHAAAKQARTHAIVDNLAAQPRSWLSAAALDAAADVAEIFEEWTC